ncbi:60S acidic ribosomal protein P1-like [Scaptodrosophila lebanonensis]|uniref:Large ribosomal subunit protein P2 n=1 Tax=Drosophila lebanonensis TaxID=7225 RepID=A0A6J2TT30_DROLE|nr:60S acidic ribosomal protein P1-like [Scaptodrosophila lebanonensis]
MSSTNHEITCICASLILAQNNVPITGEKISRILKAAEVEFDPSWPDHFAREVDGIDMQALISNIQTRVGDCTSASAPPSVYAPAKGTQRKRSKRIKAKKRKHQDSDDSYNNELFQLFD